MDHLDLVDLNVFYLILDQDWLNSRGLDGGMRSTEYPHLQTVNSSCRSWRLQISSRVNRRFMNDRNMLSIPKMLLFGLETNRCHRESSVYVDLKKWNSTKKQKIWEITSCSEKTVFHSPEAPPGGSRSFSCGPPLWTALVLLGDFDVLLHGRLIHPVDLISDVFQ